MVDRERRTEFGILLSGSKVVLKLSLVHTQGIRQGRGRGYRGKGVKACNSISLASLGL